MEKKKFVPPDLKKIIGKRIVWSMPLKELLEITDSLWPNSSHGNESMIFMYHLGRMPLGWQFTVVSGWDNWLKKKYEHQFGYYHAPESAVAAFLDYCVNKEIQPHKLMSK